MDLASVVAVMTYPLAALSVGLVSIPLFIVVWLVVKAIRIRTWNLVFLGLLGLIFWIKGVGPWMTNLIHILVGVGR
jgi:hypothetical protein